MTEDALYSAAGPFTIEHTGNAYTGHYRCWLTSDTDKKVLCEGTAKDIEDYFNACIAAALPPPPPATKPAPALWLHGAKVSPLVFRKLRFEVMVLEQHTTLNIYNEEGNSVIFEEQVPGGNWSFTVELPE